MLKLKSRNHGKGCRKVMAAISAAALVFSGNSYVSVLNDTAVYAQTGEYKTWKQSDPRWGGIYLGNSGQTIAMSGCAITSLAALVVKAGYLDETEFNPGIFCEFLNKNGGFSAYGDVYWGVVSKLVPDFNFVTTVTLNGKTAEEKAEEIKYYLDQDFYIISDVRYSCHWVAIDRVEDGVVYDIDPAGYASNVMFDKYSFEGATRLKLFRKGGSSDPVQLAPVKPVTYETGNYRTDALLNFRSEADINSDKIDLLEKDVVVTVTEISSNWGKIEYKGRTGWICLDFAYTTNDPATVFPEETEAPVTEAPVTEAETTVQTTAPVIFVPGTYLTNAKINYRENAGITYPSYGVIDKDVELSVTEISENWGKTNYNGKECWICLDFADFQSENIVTAPVTQAVTAEETKAPETTSAKESVSDEKKYKTVAVLNFRTGAGTSNGVICLVPKGTEVLVTETSGIWGKIDYNGCTGWISLEYAESVDDNQIPEITASVTTSVSQTQEPEVTTEEKITSAVTETQSAPVTTTSPSPVVTASPVITAAPVAVTTVTTTAAAVTTEAPEAEEIIVRGDLNKDGRINIVDLIRLINILLNEEIDTDFIRADVNSDGMVSSKDIVTLKSIIINNR